MMLTASALYNGLNAAGFDISLNDVCVFIPAGFGALATFMTFALTREASGNDRAGVAAAVIMAVLPAHLMRSVAGGYDNESVSIAAICATFYFWVRSIRTQASWPVGVCTGISYLYMVAAWGGYVPRGCSISPSELNILKHAHLLH